ncbi:MAG TPA: DUF1446 domain-containing protein [Marmoricola sp.]|nr:DUF1446 domain-containing protein [Marmoricola sp.]HNN48326.1 DUF1446 domain-containing protein [Marmoricola sp.]HNO39166.1 DUF1446 domain-containing protein [Marmoricola sp.]
MSDQFDPPTKSAIIGNCSGFYGDRVSAMAEMLSGGELDYLTGDYLAELTMLILGKDRMKDPNLGYAKTFLRQLESCMGTALDKGVRIVSNAGGLNPAGLAEQLHQVAGKLGLSPRIAYIDGDDVLAKAAELGFPNALTANAYLGAFGIARALDAGADIVVTGRVTDASVVVGPAIHHHGWTPTSYDELAGAVIAGHIIECGTQACGGNFSGFLQLPRDGQALGFPIAEVAADGSCVITKHDGTGGLVSVDTLSAQLLYEVQSALYLGPDVSVDLTSIQLSQQGPDRVLVSGVTGSAPPEQLKVCTNELGGFRNAMEFILTGLNIPEKAAWVRAQLEQSLAANPPAELYWSLNGNPVADADTEQGASALLRVVAMDPDPNKVGRAFSSACVELALASYPGFSMTSPPTNGSPYGIYRPEYIPRSEATETVHLPDGSVEQIPTAVPGPQQEPTPTRLTAPATSGRTVRQPLGTFVQARSGDKGGDANIGLWVGVGAKQAERAAWLTEFITVDRVRQLVPEAADLDIEIFSLPNLYGVNVLIRRLLGDGVAATTRFDPQAKGLGEWVRSRLVDVPEELA